MRIAADLPARRRPSLTPMVDVVFLLLVFFMLAARFGFEGAVTIAPAGPGPARDWTGAPRLVEVLPDGLRLNGIAIALDAVPTALARLAETPDDAVILRPRGADVARMVVVMTALERAGFSRLVLVD